MLKFGAKIGENERMLPIEAKFVHSISILPSRGIERRVFKIEARPIALPVCIRVSA